MKRKIYWNMCLVALFSMVVATLVTTWLFCRDLQEQMQLAVRTEVRYLESAVEVSGKEYLAHLASRGDGNNINRITWIGRTEQFSMTVMQTANPWKITGIARRLSVRFRQGLEKASVFLILWQSRPIIMPES